LGTEGNIHTFLFKAVENRQLIIAGGGLKNARLSANPDLRIRSGHGFLA
jgi:hypothetical protein